MARKILSGGKGAPGPADGAPDPAAPAAGTDQVDTPQSAEWEVLGQQAEQLGADGQPAPGAPGAPPPEQPTVSDQNRGVIVMLLSAFRELACAMLKVQSPRVTLADQQVETIAGVLSPLAEKHSVNLAGMMGNYALEFAAVTVAGPLLWRAYSELDAELVARKGQKKVSPDTSDQVAGQAAAPAAADPPIDKPIGDSVADAIRAAQPPPSFGE